MTKYLMVLVIFFFTKGNVNSVEPDEILNNEILESKARQIGKNLDVWFARMRISKTQMQI